MDVIPGANWTQVAERVLAEGGVAMAVGAIDTGKSTFLRWLAARAQAAGRRVWRVDADVGQSELGPPTTLAAAPWGARARVLYFVGHTSPRGHMLPCVVGARRLLDRALEEGADLVLVNTTGWVDDGAAAALKVAKIDLLRPRFLLTFRRHPGDLSLILAPYRRSARPILLDCAPSPARRSRSPEEREARRRERWAEYLQPAGVLELPLDQVGVSGEDPGLLPRTLQPGRVVGLYDGAGECLAVGVALGLSQGRLRLRAPADPAAVRRVHFGTAVLPLPPWGAGA
jgi:polynucleotide 5'-hydroxyl-kinase GRC3/NOL9